MQPISLLPGLACDAEQWREQVAALSPLLIQLRSDAIALFEQGFPAPGWKPCRDVGTCSPGSSRSASMPY